LERGNDKNDKKVLSGGQRRVSVAPDAAAMLVGYAELGPTGLDWDFVTRRRYSRMWSKRSTSAKIAG
jgi:hypothetical protein